MLDHEQARGLVHRSSRRGFSPAARTARYKAACKRVLSRFASGVRRRLPLWCSGKSGEDGDECKNGELRRVEFNNADANATFVDNFVATSKYEVWNFLPLFLLEQLTRPANAYFLIIGVLQCIDLFTLVRGFGRYGTLITLSIMISISGVREIIDDVHRHRQDRRVNNASTHVVGEGERKWGEVRVGDLIKVCNKEHLPADIVLLATSSTDGIVFVETKNLDGETNLKRKMCSSALQEICCSEKAMLALCGRATCDPPNDQIYKFSGSVTVESSEPQQQESDGSKLVAVAADNVLVRGSSIQNTDFVYGLVVYAGLDTKLMKNMKPPPKKTSYLEKQANYYLLAPVLFQIMFTSVLFGLSLKRCFERQNLWYLGANIDGVDECSSLNNFSLFVRIFTLASSFVPIGLYVTMEVARILQNYFIQNDRRMYYEPLDVYTEVRTNGLNEENGVVDYIFSDKTGTLTANEMVFQKCVIGNTIYSKTDSDDQGLYPMRVAPLDELRTAIESAMRPLTADEVVVQQQPRRSSAAPASGRTRRGGHSGGGLSQVDVELGTKFFSLLALCHTVVPETSAKKAEKNERSRMELEKIRLSEPSTDVAAPSPNVETVGAATTSESAVTSWSSYPQQQETAVAVDSVSEKERIRRNGVPSEAQRSSLAFAEAERAPKYQATSPDEAALVLAAYEQGFEFLSRSSMSMRVRACGSSQEWEVLAVIEFNSTRKRMSVVVRKLENDPKADGTSTMKGTGTISAATTPKNAAASETSDPKAAGKLFLFCKGADSVIFERLRGGQGKQVESLSNTLDAFAADGLRTLVMAHREIEEESFFEWLERYTEASSMVGAGRDEAMAAVEAELEIELELLGATAIEDKLQEKVPETLVALGRAGIKLWVCTGDKQETAINIGLSCGILDEQMDVVLLNESNLEDVEAQIDRTIGRWSALAHIKRTRNSKRKPTTTTSTRRWWSWWRFGRSRRNTAGGGTGNAENEEEEEGGNKQACSNGEDDDDGGDSDDPVVTHFGVVVDGATLNYALRPELESKFVIVARMAKTVIACRVSPKQKTEIVELVRRAEPSKVTLAIGDGANDVGMIQAAHIGVGLYGKEGVEAVLASDFATGRFHFLARLLLVHGRWNYKRLSKMVMAVIYKSILWSMMDFYSAFNINFSTAPVVDPLLGGMYNLLMTSLPTLVLAVWDYDVSQDYALMFPELYRKGHLRTSSCYRNYLSWVFAAAWHSCLVYFSARQMFLSFAAVASNGQANGLASFGTLALGLTSFVVHAYLAVFIGSWSCLTIFLWALSTLSYIFLALVFSAPSVSNAVSKELLLVANRMFAQPQFWLVFVIVSTIAALPYHAFRVSKQQRRPSLKHLVQQLMRAGLTRFDVIPPPLKRTKTKQLPTFNRRQHGISVSGYNFDMDDTGAVLRTAFRPDYRKVRMRHLKRSGSDTELDVAGIKSERMAATKHRRARSDADALKNPLMPASEANAAALAASVGLAHTLAVSAPAPNAGGANGGINVTALKPMNKRRRGGGGGGGRERKVQFEGEGVFSSGAPLSQTQQLQSARGVAREENVQSDFEHNGEGLDRGDGRGGDGGEAGRTIHESSMATTALMPAAHTESAMRRLSF